MIGAKRGAGAVHVVQNASGMSGLGIFFLKWTERGLGQMSEPTESDCDLIDPETRVSFCVVEHVLPRPGGSSTIGGRRRNLKG